MAKLGDAVIIHFAFAKWVIDEEHAKAIAAAAQLLNDPRCLDRGVQLTGHADFMGGRLYNEALSIRRAQTVADALVAAGVAPERIRVNWAGERAPETAGRSIEARSRNRRVIMTIVKQENSP